MTSHFQHNTLDGMLPALTATTEWQQGLTADHFPTQYLYFRPCMAHIHKYILWAKQRHKEAYSSCLLMTKRYINTIQMPTVKKNLNNVVLS